MIGKVTLGKNDLERAAAFYDELLKNLGASRLWSTKRFIAWSVAPDRPAVCVCSPLDPRMQSRWCSTGTPP
jgi:hypothetical protein